MTPDLRRKALARHLVHQIQLMRKEARLNVDDRIRVSVEGHGEVAAALEEHSLYICAETLAVELRFGSPPEDWMTQEVDLEEARVNVGDDPHLTLGAGLLGEMVARQLFPSRRRVSRAIIAPRWSG